MIWKILKKLFSSEEPELTEEELPLTPELIENLPAADDVKFYRDSKRLLQRFDEYITAAEMESLQLCEELDDTLEQQEKVKTQLRTLHKPGSWHERALLLQLDRLTLHGDNTKQRIEIFAQNIKVYLNLISKIQDIKAMRMNGLDEEKIETIWLEFKDTVDEYHKRLSAEEAGFQSELTTTSATESRLKELREEVLPDEPLATKSNTAKIDEVLEKRASRPWPPEAPEAIEEEFNEDEGDELEPILECS